jgi:hypothetical protein
MAEFMGCLQYDALPVRWQPTFDFTFVILIGH